MNCHQSDRQTTRRGIETLVRDFESCRLPPDDFDHSAHLLVGLWYLTHSASIEEAAERTRAGILRFLAHHQDDPTIYNETITLFWLKRLRGVLDARDADATPDTLTASALELCHYPRLINQYYSRECLASAAAKAGWVEPDLRPLDF